MPTSTPSSVTIIQSNPAYVSYENKDLGFKINAVNWSIYDNACGKNSTGYFVDSSMRTPAQNPIILY